MCNRLIIVQDFLHKGRSVKGGLWPLKAEFMESKDLKAKDLSESKSKFELSSFGSIVLPFSLIILQIWLCLYLFDFYEFHSKAFSVACQVFLGGAVLSWMLPKERRAVMLIFSGLLGAFFVFTPMTAAGTILVLSISAYVCTTEIKFKFKVTLLFLLAALSIFVAAKIKISDAWSFDKLFLTSIGSVFAFRLILLLRYMKYSNEKLSLQDAFSYFLLLPNLTMSFSPVLDFESFINDFKKEEDFKVYQEGIDKVFEGILQLIIYRVIKNGFSEPLGMVMSYGDLLKFMLFNYMTYLSVSGTFHIALGALALYGISVKRSHNQYLFATSFLDFWRRINIYWTDFMTNVFFYPTYFKMRRLGHRLSLVITTSIVFVVTCLMHSYQYYWIHGKFSLQIKDLLYWFIIASFVVWETVQEDKFGKKRENYSWSILPFLKHAFRISIMLLLITTLWVLWASESVSSFVSVYYRLRLENFKEFFWLAPFVFIGLLGAYLPRSKWISLEKRLRFFPWARRRDIINSVILVGLCFIGRYSFEKSLNDADRRILKIVKRERFYYKPENYRTLPNLSFYEALNTKKSHLSSKEVNFTLKKAKEEDIGYPIEKKTNSLRVALLGSSMSNGWNNGDEKILSWAKGVQKFLNKKGYPHIEFLNFSVAGNSLAQYPYLLEQQVIDFNPDIYVFELGTTSFKISKKNISLMFNSGVFPYPDAYELFHVRDKSSIEALNYPENFPDDLLIKYFEWSFKRSSELVSKTKGKPFLLLLPQANRKPIPSYERQDEVLNIAAKHGFESIDLRRAFDGYRYDCCARPDGNHYNEEGTDLVSKAFLEKFLPYLDRTQKLRSLSSVSTGRKEK
ncbi:MAG: SGNH/GDSL hydrolase family protein [Bdellovibrionota bacterium]